MSDAQLPDLIGFLEQRREDLKDALVGEREQNMTAHGARGTLVSGPAMKSGVKRLSDGLAQYIAEMMDQVPAWPSEFLTEQQTRATIAAHLYDTLNEFLVFDYAYRVGTRKPPPSAIQATNEIIQKADASLRSKVRAFELGAVEQSAQSSANITVNAHTIIGGVQQSGGDATQNSSVQFTK